MARTTRKVSKRRKRKVKTRTESRGRQFVSNSNRDVFCKIPRSRNGKLVTENHSHELATKLYRDSLGKFHTLSCKQKKVYYKKRRYCCPGKRRYKAKGRCCGHRFIKGRINLCNRNWSRISVNPFINFLRCYRRRFPKDCDPSYIARQGRLEWKKMTCSMKKPYYEQAKRARIRGYRT